MKMIKYVIVGAMLFATTTYGQINPQDPTPLNDPAVGTQLDKDFDGRNSGLANTNVSWYGTEHGYYGTYSDNGVDYLTRYDKNGNYIETFNKKEWSTDVTPGLKSSFEKSPYKDEEVTGYWESTDQKKKGYYLELSDKNGMKQRVWSDDKGQFSKKPISVSANTKPFGK